MFHIGSKYSVLLFQYIASLTNVDHVQSKTFSVKELRALLGIPERKLGRFSNLNHGILQPFAVAIKQLSRLILTANPNKIGRTVFSVPISWQVKEGPRAAKQELARPKVRRTAHREGTVETQARAFPAFGSIAHDAHWMRLKQAAGRNIGNGLIADKCRAWCRDKGIALDAPSIKKAFRNFCAKVGKV